MESHIKRTYTPFSRLNFVLGVIISIWIIFTWTIFAFDSTGTELIIFVLSTLPLFFTSVYLILYGYNMRYEICTDCVHYTNWLGKSQEYPYSSFTKVELVTGGRMAARYRFYCGNRTAFYIIDTKTNEPLMCDVLNRLPVAVKTEFYVRYRNNGVEKFEKLKY